MFMNMCNLIHQKFQLRNNTVYLHMQLHRMQHRTVIFVKVHGFPKYSLRQQGFMKIPKLNYDRMVQHCQ